MKKLICMIPTSGKTIEQIQTEAIEAFKAAGFFKEEAIPVPRIDLSISESVVFKVRGKLQETEELGGLSNDEVMKKVSVKIEELIDLAISETREVSKES